MVIGVPLISNVCQLPVVKGQLNKVLWAFNTLHSGVNTGVGLEQQKPVPADPPQSVDLFHRSHGCSCVELISRPVLIQNHFFPFPKTSFCI